MVDFADIYARNSWNFSRVVEACGTLPPDQLKSESSGSYGSIWATLRHVLAALGVWERRLQGESPQSLDPGQEPRDLDSLLRQKDEVFARYAKHWEAGVDLQRRVDYTNTSGTPNHFTVAEILTHMALHTSDHLAQVATLVTQAGGPEVETDFMHWVNAQRA